MIEDTATLSATWRMHRDGPGETRGSGVLHGGRGSNPRMQRRLPLVAGLLGLRRMGSTDLGQGTLHPPLFGRERPQAVIFTWT